MKNKKASDLPFNWIFAIFAGAVIIFLALFFVTRYSNLDRYRYDSEIAEKLSIILNPLEGIAESSATIIEMPVPTKVNLKCIYEGVGRQELRIATQSSIGRQWQEFGAAQSIYNKYVFSNTIEEGENLYIFSKKFEMPFHVGDLIYASMSDYCFISPSNDVEDELKQLNVSNFQITGNKKACRNASRTVCFGTSGCEVNVYGLCSGFECKDEYEYGSVERKEGGARSRVVYYTTPALMYGAIFSSADNYECNLQRILFRIDLLSRLYREKARVLESKGCGTGELKARLNDLGFAASGLLKSGRAYEINDIAAQVDNVNSVLICRVF